MNATAINIAVKKSYWLTALTGAFIRFVEPRSAFGKFLRGYLIACPIVIIYAHPVLVLHILGLVQTEMHE